MKALCIGGGGPKGAWSAGVMIALAEAGELDDVGVCWGVSVGAINTAFLAVHGPQAVPMGLPGLWLDTHDDDVSVAHALGLFSLLWNSGLRDPAPLRKMLLEALDEPLTSHFCPHRAVAVSLSSGETEFGRSEQLTFEDWVEWIVASSAHPGWIDAVRIGRGWYTDGGVADVVPARRAALAGASEVIAIAHSPDGPLKPWESTRKPPGFFSRLWREAEIGLHGRTADDLVVPDGVRLRVIRPAAPLEVDMPHFDPQVSARLLEQGYEAGRSWCDG